MTVAVVSALAVDVRAAVDAVACRRVNVCALGVWAVGEADAAAVRFVEVLRTGPSVRALRTAPGVPRADGAL